MYVLSSDYLSKFTFDQRYGSSANLVLSTGSGVNGYTLDAALGEFILTHPDVRIGLNVGLDVFLFVCMLMLFTLKDPNSCPWKDLLLQRGQFHVFPSSSGRVPEIYQVSCLW
jgi:hypothetical protein